MSSRTIENESDRKITIITTTFIPCSAKLPIIALITGALFPGSVFVAPSAYFVGITAIILSGVILKKLKRFSGSPSPFVMELPPYHIPGLRNVLVHTWDRGKSFLKKAGTIIFLASGVIWFLSSFDWTLHMTGASKSILASIGSIIAPVFSPIGWGNWKPAVSTITGLAAKENVVSTFGVLYGADNTSQVWSSLQASFTQLSAYSFMVFNLLCAPCAAAIGAIRREMNNAGWTWFAVGYQTGFAYAISFLIYQFGTVFAGKGINIGFIIAIILAACFIYLLLRPSTMKELKN
jgi:ferrous iron transport protein B